MIKRLLFFLLISSSLFAQYSSADFELARTTFQRQFEPKIVDNYISSNLPVKVKAALLSLGNSQDSAFVDEIIKPDYAKFGNYIAFALGEIGPSVKSEEYLLNKLFSNKYSEFQESGYDALGRCGFKDALDRIVDKYYSDALTDFDGISLAIANFGQRGIRRVDSLELKILLNELTIGSIPIKRRIDAAFAASRLGLPQSAKKNIIKVLFENNSRLGEDGVILSQYLMACLRKLKASPDSPEQIRALIKQNDWRLRAEASKVIIYHTFRSSDELKSFLSLLNDINPNVSRQAAISLKDIKIDSSLMTLLKDELKGKFHDNSITANTVGELFIAYCKLSPYEVFTLIKELKSIIKPSFIYRALSENVSSPEENLNYLINVNFSAANNNDKLEILNALLPLQSYIKGNSQLDSYLISGISSNSPAAVSVTADGLDSVFIESHKDELRRIITRQVNLHQNDPDYSESNISLVNLSGRISPELKNDLLMVLRASKLYPMQTFACKALGKICNLSKNLNNFFGLWSYAFKYKYARVNTDKGQFVIRFSPEYAPVSVGNFCKLAESGFFNKVTFHRVVPDFVIQTGDPQGTGWGGPGYEIISEFSPIPFDKSYVGMASSGKDTEGSQWFVMHSSFPHLNGRYSNFGKVVEGMDVVSIIDQNDTVLSVELAN